jgi:hypothetical protein
MAHAERTPLAGRGGQRETPAQGNTRAKGAPAHLRWRRRGQVPRKRPQRSTRAPQAPRPRRPPRGPLARCWAHQQSPPPLRSTRQQPLSPSRQRLRMPSGKGARSRMSARPHMGPSSRCWTSCRARHAASVNPAGQCAMAAPAALRTRAGSRQTFSSRAAAPAPSQGGAAGSRRLLTRFSSSCNARGPRRSGPRRSGPVPHPQDSDSPAVDRQTAVVPAGRGQACTRRGAARVPPGAPADAVVHSWCSASQPRSVLLACTQNGRRSHATLV